MNINEKDLELIKRLYENMHHSIEDIEEDISKDNLVLYEFYGKPYWWYLDACDERLIDYDGNIVYDSEELF